jgi:Putative amidoligase enzyme
MSNSVVLSIGNTYQRLPEHQAKLDRSRTYRKVHDWVLYVDVPNDHPGDKEIIDRVTFRLGSSFVPSDYVRHCPVPSATTSSSTSGWRFCTRQQTYVMGFDVEIEVRGRGGSVRTYTHTLLARSPHHEARRNFHEPRPLQPVRMLKLAPHNFGVELELTSDLTAREIAAYISPAVVVLDDYRQGRATNHQWKLVPDGSIQCGTFLPNCHTFELVSPILNGGSGLSELHQVLRTLDQAQGKIVVNNSMGFHVHVDVSDLNLPQLIKICQTFVKYEAVLDTFFPADRRSHSPQAQRYFQSHKNMLHGTSSSNNYRRRYHVALACCTSLEELVELWSPTKYYKLNLQNLVTGRQPTMEFRQHHATANYETVSAWVRFCVAMVTNAARFPPPRPLHPARTVDEAYTFLFAYCIKDQALEEFYTKRRILAERECCSSCAGGLGCRRS